MLTTTRAAAVLLSLASLWAPAAVRAIDGARPLTQAVVDTWSRADGLPLNSVYTIAQTPDGFLWLGTQAGLVRFDGATFNVFRGGDGSGLEGEILTTVTTDRQGKLWVGGQAGLFREESPGQFQRVVLGGSPPENQLMDFYLMPDGAVWGNRPAGSFRWREGKLESFGTRYIMRVTASPDGARTYVSFPQGIVEYRGAQERPLREVGRNLPARPTGVVCDAEGRLWLTAADGLWKLEGEAFVQVLASALPPIVRLTVDRGGNLWMAFAPGGGARYSVARGELERLGGALATARLTGFAEDREGSQWIATENDGLWRLRDGAFAMLGTSEGLPYAMVNALVETADGTLYVGTDQGGLYWQRGRESGVYGPKEGLALPAVTALANGADGRLWLGFPDGRVQTLQAGKFTTYTPADGLPPSVVSQLVEDASGRVWVGHLSGGLWRGENGKFTPLAGEPGAPQRLVSLARRDSGGTLWFGTDAGFVRFAEGKFQPVTAADGLPEALGAALVERRPGEFWIGTDRTGIGRWRDGKFKLFPVDGLPRAIFALAIDDAQRLWISSNDGVSCVTFADLEAWERGELAKVPRRQFGLKDGLRSLEGRGVVGPTVVRTRDGLIRFATGKGVATVDPAAVAPLRQPAAVRVTAVTVDEIARPVAAELVLAPGWKMLRFGYSALELAAPERLVFDTWLEGYEPDWIAAGARREATYTNLPPGDYVFQVRARRTDGTGEGAKARLAFVVRPFFHQTPWFAALCVVGAGIVLSGLYWLRLRSIRARNAQLELMVVARTRELHDTAAELVKANAAKNQILAVIGHDLRGPAGALRGLTQILVDDPAAFSPAELQDVARQIDVACGAQIELLNNLLEWSRVQSGELALHPEALPAGRPVEMTVDLLAIAAREKGVALQKSIDPAAWVRADENSVYTILRNLAGNAIKFTRAGGNVTLTVAAAGSEVVYTVEDTGVGLSAERLQRLMESDDVRSTYGTNAERGTGLGLALSRDLARLNGGRLTMTSIEGQGTKVSLWLPAATPA